jgi:hypothetical protein
MHINNVSITFFLFSPLRAINIQLQTESSLHDREWICSLGKKAGGGTRSPPYDRLRRRSIFVCR